MKHWESSNYRIYPDDMGGYIVEVCCPECREWTDEEVSAVDDPFELKCSHCGSVFSCQFKVIMDRLDG